jgi:ribulose-phosphate 3-epimerase
MNLYPSLLSDSVETIQKQINTVKDLSEIKTVQIDIIDGFFADNLTISVLDLIDLDFGELTVDVHLMTEEPMDFVWELETVKERLPIRAVIAQVERMTHQQDFVDQVKKIGWQAGISLDLFTPLSEIDKNIYEKLDILQLMSIEAGFQGRKFKGQVFEKLEKVNKNKDLEIIIDGGVKPENVEKIIQAGADGVAVGSALWKASNIKEAVANFF